MAANCAGQMDTYALCGFITNCRMVTLFGHVVKLTDKSYTEI